MAATAALANLAGCPLPGDFLTPTIVTVELVNNTTLDVAPNIRFDDSEGFLASAFPAEELATGLLAPDDVLAFDFDCDALGIVLSDEAEQILSDSEVAVAVTSRVIERNTDYVCGDIVRFIFVGEGVDFGVVVSVNGRVID